MPVIVKPSKSVKDKNNKDIIAMADVEKEAKSFIQRVLGDISKTSASKQIVLGASSGWVFGYESWKDGSTSTRRGIILLQVANEKGYININWDKVSRNVDKVTDKIEESVTGQGPSWMDKAERIIDKKITKVEDTLKKGQKKAKKWYSGFLGEDTNELKEVHIFLISFVAGIAIGVGTS